MGQWASCPTLWHTVDQDGHTPSSRPHSLAPVPLACLVPPPGYHHLPPHYLAIIISIHNLVIIFFHILRRRALWIRMVTPLLHGPPPGYTLAPSISVSPFFIIFKDVKIPNFYHFLSSSPKHFHGHHMARYSLRPYLSPLFIIFFL